MPHRWLERRRLGEILVERGLLTSGGLRRALDEQEKTGRLLGEILVERGWISIDELADALDEQEVPTDGAGTDGEPGAPPRRPPLGQLLITKGLITPEVLEIALADQRLNWRPLGQILVGMGALNEEDLGRTLTEQHGFDFSRGLRARIAADDGPADVPPPPDPAEASVEAQSTEPESKETYVVREPGNPMPLHHAGSLLDAADVAFEVIEKIDPTELEIVRTSGDHVEVVWSYDRDAEQGDLSARLHRERDPVEHLVSYAERSAPLDEPR